MHRWVAVGVAVVTVSLSLVACAARPPQVEAGAVNRHFGLSGFDDPAAEDAVLTGPYFEFEVIGVKTVGSLGDLHPTEDADYRPPDGHELVAALFDGRYVGLTSDPSLDVRVEVGGENVMLDEVPAANEAVVVAAPEDAPVHLVVVDHDGRQSIDLRTGQRVEEFPLFYAESPEQDLSYTYTGSGTVPGPPGAAFVDGQLVVQSAADPVDLTIELGTARIEGWAPVGGYALPGRAWLRIEVTGGSAQWGCALAATPATSSTFTLVDAAGTATPAQGHQLHVLGFPPGPIDFDVPEGFTAGSLRITPGAGPLVDSAGSPRTCGWITPPAEAEVAINLT